MVEQFANNASSTLSSSIGSGDATLTVVSGTPFSSTGNFRIVVDSEIMLVTARASNTLSITRAQEGTIAASHSSGVTVTQIVTAGAISQLKIDTTNGAISTGAYSNRPSAGTSGRIYFPNDPGPVPFFDNGTAWQPIVTNVLSTQVPAAVNWSLFSGTSTLVNSFGTLLVTPSTADELWQYTGTLNTSFTVVTALSQLWKPGVSDNPGFGVFVRNSGVTSSNVGYVRCAVYNATGVITTQVQEFTGSGTPGSASTVLFTGNAAAFDVSTYWYKTNWNNSTSTVTFSISNNGIDYYQLYSGTPFQSSPGPMQFGLIPMGSSASENLCRLLSMATS